MAHLTHSVLEQVLQQDAESAAILESTVRLAAAFDLELVAEGVETAAVRDRLADPGRTTAQGLLSSPSVEAARLHRWTER